MVLWLLHFSHQDPITHLMALRAEWFNKRGPRELEMKGTSPELSYHTESHFLELKGIFVTSRSTAWFWFESLQQVMQADEHKDVVFMCVFNHQSPEKFVRASLLLFVSAMARLNCSRMLFSSDERCSVRCSATRRRSFKAWNSLWYAISFSIRTNKEKGKVGCISRW